MTQKKDKVRARALQNSLDIKVFEFINDGDDTHAALASTIIDQIDEDRGELIDRDALCKYLGISKSMEANYRDENGQYYDPEFPKPVKIGRKNLYQKADVARYLARLRPIE